MAWPTKSKFYTGLFNETITLTWRELSSKNISMNKDLRRGLGQPVSEFGVPENVDHLG